MKTKLFEFENNYDASIDEALSRNKHKYIRKMHIKAILGGRGELSQGIVTETEIKELVEKVIELYDKHKSFVKVYANIDGVSEKINGKYKNQTQIDKMISVGNYYRYRDKDKDNDRAMVEKARIYDLCRVEVSKIIPMYLPIGAIAIILVILVLLKRTGV